MAGAPPRPAAARPSRPTTPPLNQPQGEAKLRLAAQAAIRWAPATNGCHPPAARTHRPDVAVGKRIVGHSMRCSQIQFVQGAGDGGGAGVVLHGRQARACGLNVLWAQPWAAGAQGPHAHALTPLPARPRSPPPSHRCTAATEPAVSRLSHHLVCRLHPFSSPTPPPPPPSPSATYVYALDLCLGVNTKPGGAGPSRRSLILTQSAGSGDASSVSRSDRPAIGGGRHPMRWGVTCAEVGG